ncbi:MAG: pyridoxamine 5'-phosphate oxidase family protein [Gemmatimonadales bacterium]
MSQQPMAVFASVDAGQRPWASVLLGAPGFLRADSPTRITMDLSCAWPNEGDPLWPNLERDARVGLLF